MSIPVMGTSTFPTKITSCEDEIDEQSTLLPWMSIRKQELMASSNLRRASTLPRPLPWLATKVAIFVSPLSLLVEASLIQHHFLEGFGHFTSVLPRFPLQLATQVALSSYPLSPLIEELSNQCYLFEGYG